MRCSTFTGGHRKHAIEARRQEGQFFTEDCQVVLVGYNYYCEPKSSRENATCT